ncbi:DUF3883 domain-containing protein [Pseudonocardia sp. MCCB 268]|nr:DUF3883 domain-containing protein [Pseudonocardia cytotoxica]
MAHNNPGFTTFAPHPDGHLVHLEVRGRLRGAEDFVVTRNEVLLGRNAPSYLPPWWARRRLAEVLTW